MAIIAIIAWSALALQLSILLRNVPTNGLSTCTAPWNFFSYFTILTNLLVAISLSYGLIPPLSSPGRFFSKPTTMAAIVVYITIVGIVYNIVLRFIWATTGLQSWVDEALHAAVPVLFVVFGLVFVGKGMLRCLHPVRWLAYPSVYLVYALLLGEFSGFYAYPFINSSNLGYSRVVCNMAGLIVVFTVTGLLFVPWIKKWRTRITDR